MPADSGRPWSRAAVLAGLTLTLAACAGQPAALTGSRIDANGAAHPVSCAQPLAPEPADDRDAPEDGSAVGRSAALILSEGVFRACEAYLNGAIDAAEYQRQLAAYPRLAAGLMAIEALGWGDFPKRVPPGGDGRNRPPTRVEAIERIIDGLKKP